MPGALSISMLPSNRSAIAFDIARPSPVPPVLRAARWIAAIEAVKYVRQHLGVNAAAVIGDTQFNLCIQVRGTDLNDAARATVLDCVQDQVGAEQPQLLRIDVGDHVIRNCQLHRDTTNLRKGLELLYDLACDLANVGRKMVSHRGLGGRLALDLGQRQHA